MRGSDRTKHRTVDLVLLLLAIAHEHALDPVARKNSPCNDAERVPGEVDERGLRVPQREPKVCAGDVVLDVELCEIKRRRAAVLLVAAEVERVGEEGNAERDGELQGHGTIAVSAVVGEHDITRTAPGGPKNS